MITSQDAFFASANEGKSFHVVTDTLTIKVPSERVNGAYSVTEDVTPPGGRNVLRFRRRIRVQMW
ncbi:MAG: hypothetical protein M3Y53_01655 [Thermoproteota archaeon]|nr:hypothetical protein [Thermoproteota archaeon]